jgi:dolichol-phosphate mannosyltransferase
MPKENDIIVQGIKGVPDYEVRRYREKKNVTALLIPVLNEERRILDQLVAMSLYQLDVDVVIADGGSNDDTRENIEKNKLAIHAFLTKRGSGALSAQLRMGFDYCLSQEYDFVITIDGNNKDDFTRIPNFILALKSGIDFVQGSRFIRGGKAVNTPLLRYLGIRLVHAPLTSLAARHLYTDSTNGFRGHSAKLLRHPEIQVFRDIFLTYELLAYLPIRAHRIGLRVHEVPVSRRYPKGIATPTKIHGFGAQFKLFNILLKAVSGKYDPDLSCENECGSSRE